MRVWKLLFAFAAAACLSYAVDDGRFHWIGHVADGGSLEIKGLNGGIRAEPSTGKDVEVVALKDGHGDASSVRIDVVEHDGSVTLCAVYPPGHWFSRQSDIRVDFAVRVPPGVRLVARTVNGNVDATGLRGDLEAHTVNGDVHFNAAGSAQASTVNGSITGSMERMPDGGRNFSTVNGSITLRIPNGADADVRASTVTGRISTDFPLTVHGGLVGKSLKGTIGRGGRELKLNTINGSIQLLYPARI